MQKLRGAVADGQCVLARGEPWQVVSHERFDSCVLVTLRGTGDDNRGRHVRLLVPFDRLTAAPSSARLVRRRRQAALRGAGAALARAHEWFEPWCALHAKIDWLPWQFEPAMAAVAGATRLLLCDEVGLGKTIQAGLILLELRARGLVSRTLILTPASLRHQWAAELRDRLDIDCVVFDHEALITAAARLPAGVNPWTAAEVAISSIDLVKRADVRSSLDAAPLDLLIVDEAHHLTPESDRGAVVADLAGRTAWVALATATPHSGDSAAFEYLSQLGGTEPDLPATFRRTARLVGQRAARHVHLHRVGMTEAERALIDEAFVYATALWRRREAGHAGAAVVASVICRRAVSSSRALARTLARRRRLLSESDGAEPAHPQLPWLEEDEMDGPGRDGILSMRLLEDVPSELAWLDRLGSLAGHIDCGSKVRTLERLLSRVHEPAIVFSEYRDTLSELEERLSARFSIAMLHGGLSSQERREAIQRFRSGAAQLLLASDAAGEGLNLQERSRLVINVELPWNPVRLEQRIGRVDRLGQRRRVHAIHLCLRDSFEERVLSRLQSRRARAELDLRVTTVDEQTVARAIFDSSSIALTPSRTSGPRVEMTHNQAAAELRRAALALAARHNGHRHRAGAACAALPRRHGLARGVALLFEWDVFDRSLRIVARQTAGILVTFTAPRRLTARAARRVIRSIAACHAVQREIDRARADGVRRAASETAVTSAALETRLAAIDERLRRRRPTLLQMSLFDKRAERRAQASRESVEALRRHLDRQTASLRGLQGAASPFPHRLVAAWAVAAE